MLLLSDSKSALRGILPSTGRSEATASFRSLEMMHLPHSWSSYAFLWDSPNPPSWSARMTSSSRPRVSQAMAKMSRPMITAGLSLANTRMCLNSVTLSIASSTWTLPIEMSTASLVIWFSKMIKISARRGSWSEKILLVSKCWVGAAISELYHDDKGYSRSHFSPPFFRLLIFRYGEILLEDWIFLSFRWLWIITLIWWRPRRNLGAGCHGLFFSSGLVTLHRWHMEPKE